MEKLKCPCCGKELYRIASTDAFIEQLIRVMREHPEDAGELIVGMFTIMHNPEAGEPLSEDELRELLQER